MTVQSSDFDVSPDEKPEAVCPYCEHPFRTDRQRDLHVGERHDGTDEEQVAYEAALESEEDDLFVFHLKVLFALGAVYAAFIVLAVVAFSLAG